MVEATILRTTQAVSPGLSGLEPESDVTAGTWNHICLDAESRHKEAVNHIFAGKYQLNLPTHGYVEFVDLAPSVRVLKSPHPLLGRYVNIHRIGGVAIDVKI